MVFFCFFCLFGQNLDWTGCKEVNHGSGWTHTHSSTHVNVHFACAKLTSLHTEVLFAECVCISVFERG